MQARMVMSAITQLGPRNLPQIMRNLANSNFPAAFDAMCAVAIYSQEPADKRIAVDFLENGKLRDFYKAGNVDTQLLISVLCPAATDAASADHLMKALEAYPDLKMQICKDLTRYVAVNHGVPGGEVPEVLNIRALEYIVEKGPRNYENILYRCAMSADANLKVRQFARDTLLEIVNSRKADGKQPVNRLLVDGHLPEFVQEFGNEPWADGKDLEAAYKEWVETIRTMKKAGQDCSSAMLDEVAKQLAGDTPMDPQDAIDLAEEFVDKHWKDATAMETILQGKETLVQKYRELKSMETKAKEMRAKLLPIIAQRAKRTIDQLNALAAKAGVQSPPIRFNPDPTYFDPNNWDKDIGGDWGVEKGGYNQGDLELRESLLMIGTYPDNELMKSGAHEMGHHEQSDLMLRRIIDLVEIERQKLDEHFKIGKTCDDVSIRNEIRTLWDKRTAELTLPDQFMDSVLENRAGKRLDDAGEARAEELIQDRLETVDAITKEIELEDRIKDSQLLQKRMSKREPLKSILGIQHPDEYRASIERLLGLETLPISLSDKVSQMVRAEKEGAANAGQLRGEVYRVIELSIEKRINQLNKTILENYRDSLAEEESHRIDESVTLLGTVQEERRAMANAVERRVSDEEERTKVKDPKTGEHEAKSDDHSSEEHRPLTLTDAEIAVLGGLDSGDLHAQSLANLAEIHISNEGVQTGGEHAHKGPLAARWGRRIEELQKAASDPVNQEHQAEIKEQLELSRKILEHLRRAEGTDPLHAEHTKALNEAATLMEQVSEHAHAAAEGGEHGRGLADRASEQRGRLTSLTMLLKELLPKLIGH